MSIESRAKFDSIFLTAISPLFILSFDYNNCCFPRVLKKKVTFDMKYTSTADAIAIAKIS